MISKMMMLALTSALVLGCGKGEEGEKTSGEKTDTADKKDKTDSKKPADKKGGDPSVWQDLEMPKLGLIASAPGNAKVGSMGGIQTADWKCRLGVFEMSKASSSFENWVTNIEKGNKGGPLKEMVKKEKTDDDTWVLQWTTEKGKFAYAARRKIGEKVFTCVNFQADSKEKQDCAIKICESLKAK